jgi:hypothetical protein
MGYYKILCGRLLSEKTAMEMHINMRPSPTHRIKPRPAHSQIFSE